MRYFVDEAPKDRISLLAELNFIKSYIELEKMRMRYPLAVTIEKEGVDENVMVPPMLLIPLVENVFKHGIDKLRDDNFIYLSLSIQNNRLFVTVENRLIQPSGRPIKVKRVCVTLRAGWHYYLVRIVPYTPAMPVLFSRHK
jgi:LytS/YehU family sensor histidine kinase